MTEDERRIIDMTLKSHRSFVSNRSGETLCRACYDDNEFQPKFPCRRYQLAEIALRALDHAERAEELLEPLAHVNLQPWSHNFFGDPKNWNCPWCKYSGAHDTDCPIIKWQYEQLPTVGELSTSL